MPMDKPNSKDARRALAAREQAIRTSQSGDARNLSALLAADPSLLECKDGGGRDLLMIAASSGKADNVEWLLGRLPADAVDGQGWTALMHAAHLGRTAAALLLIPHSPLEAQGWLSETLISPGGAVDPDGSGPTAPEKVDAQTLARFGCVDEIIDAIGHEKAARAARVEAISLDTEARRSPATSTAVPKPRI